MYIILATDLCVKIMEGDCDFRGPHHVYSQELVGILRIGRISSKVLSNISVILVDDGMNDNPNKAIAMLMFAWL